VELARFGFASGTLDVVEHGPNKRAALHLVRGPDELASFDQGGLEVFEIDVGSFAGALRRNNHTLKRALTDPRILSGIGNAYSDEILHEAQLSPVALTGRLSDVQIERLFGAVHHILATFTERLRAEVGDGFPAKVTAFRPDMAVHGRYGQPCPRCGSLVQRIVYASRETNYCARCQTGGRPLADRALSRLLGKDWPKTMEELELRRTQGRKWEHREGKP
jgi:formamidopyrimidine-DNA glycosylase